MAHNDNLGELSPKVRRFYKELRELFADWELQADIEKAISWSTDVNNLVSKFFAFHDNDLNRFEQAEFLKWFAEKTGINDSRIEWDLIEEYKTSATHTHRKQSAWKNPFPEGSDGQILGDELYTMIQTGEIPAVETKLRRYTEQYMKDSPAATAIDAVIDQFKHQNIIEEAKTAPVYTYGKRLRDRVAQELNKLSKIELEPENDSDVIYNISLIVASLKRYTKTKLDTNNNTISKAESLANSGNYPGAYGALTIATDDLTRSVEYTLEKLEEIASKLKPLE